MNRIKILYMIIFLEVFSLQAMETPNESEDLKEYTSSTSDVVSPDHSLLVRTAFSNYAAKMYEIPDDGNLKEKLDLGRAENVSFSPDSKYIAFSTLGKKHQTVAFTIRELATGKDVYLTTQALILRNRPVFSNANSILFGVPLENKEQPSLIIGWENKVFSWTTLNKKNVILSGVNLKNKQVILFNIPEKSIDLVDYKGKLERQLQLQGVYPPSSAAHLRTSSDGSALAWTNKEKVHFITSIEKSNEINTLCGKGAINDLAFSPDAAHLAITRNNEICIVNTQTQQSQFVFELDKLAPAHDLSTGFLRASWNENSFFIRFAMGKWIKADSKKINEMINQKEKEVKVTKSLE